MYNFIYNVFSIPFGYIIGFFYDLSENYILSLLLMTLCVKLILLPSSIKQQKGMVKTQRMQPKIRRIREKYAGNQQKMNEAMNELYAKEGYSSMTGGCTGLLIQFPVMMGVFAVNYRLMSYVIKIPKDIIETLKTQVLTIQDLTAYEKSPLRLELTALSHFNELDLSGIPQQYVTEIETFIEKFSLFGINLSTTPNIHMGKTLLWLIPVLTCLTSLATGIYTYIRQKKTNPEMAKNPSMGCMSLMGPVMSTYFSFLFPASVGIYIIMSNALSFIQMIITNKVFSPKKVLAKTMVDETINRRAREKILINVADTLDDDKTEV